MFLLSGGSREELLIQINTAARVVERSGELSFAALLRRYGRSAAGPHRLGLIAANHEQLGALLREAHSRIAASSRPSLRIRARFYYGSGAKAGKVAVLFPGQGSQFPGMLSELRRTRPRIAAWFQALDEAYLELGLDRPAAILDKDGEADPRLFDFECGAQLELAASLSLYELLQNLGIRADGFAGHSNGEHAALMASGRVRFESIQSCVRQMARVGADLAQLPEPQPAEGMIAVNNLDRERLSRRLAAFAAGRPDQVFLAIDNCPMQVLLGGHSLALDSLGPQLQAEGAIVSRLPFRHAHHTPLFLERAAVLARQYQDWRIEEGSAPVYCSRSADVYPSGEKEMLRLLAAQFSSQVRFRETVDRMWADGYRIFLEAGPDAKLCAMVDDTLRQRPHRSLAASSSARGDLEQLHLLAAELFAEGISIDPRVLDEEEVESYPATLVPVRKPSPASPPLNAQRAAAMSAAFHQSLLQQYRLTVQLAENSMARVSATLSLPILHAASIGRAGPLLGKVVERTAQGLAAQRRFSRETDPFLRDHSLGRSGRTPGEPMPVLAFTVAMEIAAEAAACLYGQPAVELTSMRAHQWLALERGSIDTRIEARAAGLHKAHVRIYDVSGNRLRGAASPLLCFEATVRTAALRPHPQWDDTAGGRTETPAPEEANRSSSAGARSVVLDAARFYRDYAFHGPSFRGLRSVTQTGDSRLTAELVVTRIPGLAPEDLQLDPALMDCAGQLVALWLLDQEESRCGLFPFAADRLLLYSAPPQAAESIRCRATAERSPAGTTLASFQFARAGGDRIAALTGFAQRIVRFPPSVSAMLFGNGPLRIDPADRKYFEDTRSIWIRALAHLTLDPASLERWYTLPEQGEARFLALFSRDSPLLTDEQFNLGGWSPPCLY